MVTTSRTCAELDTLLERWDGRHLDRLDRFADEHPADLELLLHLTRLAEHADLPAQITSTALLKRYLVGGFDLPEPLVERLLDLLAATTHWESTLHLLQILPVLSVPAVRSGALYGHLVSLLSDHNKLIRAWSYSGLHRLATQHAEYRPQVAAFLQRANADKSAAVRARLRHLAPLLSEGT